MAVAKDSRKTGMRILLGVVVLLLGGSMLLYLVPQTPGTGEASSTDIVAKVGDETVSAAEVRQQLSEIEQRNQVPKQLESLYARQILNQLIFQNEKVKLDYAFIKPEDLEAKITPDQAEIKAAYEKNRSRYQVPEKRVVRYGLIDLTQLRQNAQISDAELKAQYQQNIQQYEVPNRVHAEHVLLMTVGKTDAEVEEIHQKAEDVLKQANKGANF